jgi:hypothetical protein
MRFTADGNATLANNLAVNGGVQVKGGTNARIGQATLSGGTATVSNTSVTTNTRFVLTSRSTSNVGALTVGTVTAGASFVVNSSNALDAGTFDYTLIEQN